jgi:hypothetical protein
MNINNFLPGDKIVRVDSSKPYNSGVRDRSYIGEKLIFVGITNGQLYCERTDELSILGDNLLELSLDMWGEGWEYYIDPKSLRIRDFKFK